MTKLLDINPIEAAAAWLVEQTGDKDITASYLVDQCRLGEIKILAATPGWNDIGDGEVHWTERVSAKDPRAPTACIVLANGDTWIDEAPLVSIGSYISGDGLLLVTHEMASRLLNHGRSGLSCARLQVIETSEKKRKEAISLGRLAEDEEMITGEQLLGTHDGRMVDFSHLRVRRSELEAFAARQEPSEQFEEAVITTSAHSATERTQPVAARSTRKTRIDGLRLAMNAGIVSYEKRFNTEPTARALFVWLAENDETGNIEDFDHEQDIITWKRSDGGLGDTTFKAFANRFSSMKKE